MRYYGVFNLRFTTSLDSYRVQLRKEQRFTALLSPPVGGANAPRREFWR